MIYVINNGEQFQGYPNEFNDIASVKNINIDSYTCHVSTQVLAEVSIPKRSEILSFSQYCAKALFGFFLLYTCLQNKINTL